MGEIYSIEVTKINKLQLLTHEAKKECSQIMNFYEVIDENGESILLTIVFAEALQVYINRIFL